MYPALGDRSLPAWAATAPRLTVLEANVYDQNAEPDAAAAKILASGADVLVVVEMDSRTLQALRRQGVDQTYPYSTLPGGRYRADVIWSKRPLTDVHARQSSRTDMPWATVDVGDRSLFLVAVHVDNAIRTARGLDAASWTALKHAGHLRARRRSPSSATSTRPAGTRRSATCWRPGCTTPTSRWARACRARGPTSASRCR